MIAVEEGKRYIQQHYVRMEFFAVRSDVPEIPRAQRLKPPQPRPFRYCLRYAPVVLYYEYPSTYPAFRLSSPYV